MQGSDKRSPYAQHVTWPRPDRGGMIDPPEARAVPDIAGRYAAAIAEEERAAAIAARAGERHRRIAAVAYRIAAAKGFSSDTALEDWREAEREVRAEELRQAGPPLPAVGPQDH